MWRSVSGERGSSSGDRSAALPGPQLASLGLSSQESPLLGLLSAVSRPAVSFLQRWSLFPSGQSPYLSGQSPYPSGQPPYPSGQSLKQDVVQTEREFLQQLDDLLPPTQLHSLPWFNLSELGITSPEDPRPPHTSSCTMASTGPGIQTEAMLSHVLLQPPCTESQTWPRTESKSWSRAGSKPWLGVWSSSDDERLKNVIISGLLNEKRNSAFVHTEGGVKTLPPALLHGLGLSTAPTLIPDLDHGYSSLEEEQLQARAQLRREEAEEETTVKETTGKKETVTQEEEESASEEEPQVEEEEPVLKCENKAIAFIMGCPCSDDSDNDDDDDDEDDDDDDEALDEDDDGFDSVCSSEISDSDPDSDRDEEEEFDSETERLWSSLCQNHDPYSLRNFTAKLCSAPKPGSRPRPDAASPRNFSTGPCSAPKPEPGPDACSLWNFTAEVCSAPRPIPRPGPGPDEVQSSPGSSLSSSSSSTSSSSWDEASEAEAEETLRLLASFSSSSDPYSPFNFQASIRTKTRARTKAGLEPEPGLELRAERKPSEEEEERVKKVSGSSQKNSMKKQVRFRAEVSVFSVGCEERRGPWEEFARDRARFAKRCGEIEQTLRICLSQEHRRKVYLRISQSESSEQRSGQSERSKEEKSQSEAESEAQQE